MKPAAMSKSYHPRAPPPRVGGGVTLKLAVAATRLPPAGAVVRAFTAICVE